MSAPKNTFKLEKNQLGLDHSPTPHLHPSRWMYAIWSSVRKLRTKKYASARMWFTFKSWAGAALRQTKYGLWRCKICVNQDYKFECEWEQKERNIAFTKIRTKSLLDLKIDKYFCVACFASFKIELGKSFVKKKIIQCVALSTRRNNLHEWTCMAGRTHEDGVRKCYTENLWFVVFFKVDSVHFIPF